MIEKINLAHKAALFQDHWKPRILAELNGQQVKLAKLQGEFVWHRHEREDELFLVLRGQLTMRLRDGEVTLSPGELIVVPAGVEHCPAAAEEVEVLLFEPASTCNTGDQRNARTIDRLERI